MLSPFILGAENGVIWHSLADILVLLGGALLLGTTAERLRQSSIVGYIAAGAIVGPNLLGWVANERDIFDLAELGVALLLFAIGLEFSVKRLRKLGRVPLLAGLLQVVLTLLVTAGIAVLIGRPTDEAVAIGAMVALSSTACVIRMLNDRAELDSPHGRTALGILLVQDMAVVPLMLIVTALMSGGTPQAILGQLAVSLLLAVVLIAVFYGVFNYLLPRLLVLRSLRQNRDFPILLTMVMAVGSAWSAHRVGLSPALGAFVAGVLLAVSPFATQIRADVQPLKTVLVTLFFAAVGMFADFGWVFGHLGLVAAVVGVIVVGKLLMTFSLAWLCGQPWQFALGAGLCLAQVGEFSFVLATVARGDAGSSGILSEEAFRAMVSATIVTLLMTPYFVQAAPGAAAFARRHVGRRTRRSQSQSILDDVQNVTGTTTRHDDPPADGPRPIMIIGFGPAGQRVAGELLQAGLKNVVVVDLNRDNIQVAERYGLKTQLGDATQIEVLEHAGLYDAELVVITIPTTDVSRQLIHLVRQLAPAAIMFVRCRYHLHHWQLLTAGAHLIVDEEENVGERLAHHVLESVRVVPMKMTPLSDVSNESASSIKTQ